MGLIQFEQNGVKHLVVEVNKGSNCFSYEYERLCFNHSDNMPDYVMLPFKCEVVGTLSDITEEQSAEMVKCNNNTYIKPHYWNYTEEMIGIFRFQHLAAIDSLKSRIRSLGGSNEANYLILKEVGS